MANSLGSNEGAIIARTALDTLLENYAFLGMITGDYSDEGALFNQAIKVKLPTAITSADASSGYSASDVTQADKTVTINTHEHATYAFTDQELSSTNQNLLDRFGRNAGHAIGKSIVTDIYDLILNANYSNVLDVALASFGADDMVTLQTDLDTLNVPPSGRYAVLNRSFYKALLGETTLIANAGSPSGAVRSGELGDVYGFRTFSAAVPDNSETLAGFVGNADALLLATRVPMIPENIERNCTIENIVEPNTGLTLQVRTWYDPAAGKAYVTITSMWGVGVGNPSALKRITDAT